MRQGARTMNRYAYCRTIVVADRVSLARSRACSGAASADDREGSILVRLGRRSSDFAGRIAGGLRARQRRRKEGRLRHAPSGSRKPTAASCRARSRAASATPARDGLPMAAGWLSSDRSRRTAGPNRPRSTSWPWPAASPGPSPTYRAARPTLNGRPTAGRSPSRRRPARPTWPPPRRSRPPTNPARVTSA